MPAPRAPTVTQFARRLAIETPEHLVLELELAGVGSRVAAAACDAVLLGSVYLAVALGLGSLATRRDTPWSSLVAALFFVASFCLFWGYFLLFEAFNHGRTPGKLLLGVRVVMDTGHPITLAAAAVRNLLRAVDMLPVPLVGLAFMLFHDKNKRLGDMVAGTVVARDRPEDVHLAAGSPQAAPPPEPREPEPLEPGPPELSDDEFRLLDQYLERSDRLAAGLRRRFTAELVARFAARFPRRDPDPDGFLVRLHDAELGKRRGRLATRQAQGVGRTAIAAERFVLRKRDAWEAFGAVATQAERSGLKRLRPADIPAFAARYREVAADLARARTYGVDPRVVEYLERLVSAGHNALYGRHVGHRVRLRPVLFGELPASVLVARAYVLTAALVFAVPAATGYVLLRERPAIAEQVLPDGVIARAREGAEHRAQGLGYAEAPSMYLPVVASRIITNNVQVAFLGFAFGITAGIGTLLLLVFNGLFFGAVLGLFANHGLAGWLLTFVAGHGVLELTAIFIAGGAGFRVARALIAPGEVTRRDALILAGREAARLVGAAVLLLCLAGTIEGLLSASDAPAPLKLGTSAATILLLALYLASGRHYLTTRASAGAQAAATATSDTPRA